MKRLFPIALMLIASSAYTKDLGFRYSDGKCKNGKGVEGLNPGLIGQCGDLKHVTIRNFTMDEVDLSGSDLTGADMQGCSFVQANLTAVKFVEADLSGANFDGALFQETNLTKAILLNAHVAGAQIKSADFSSANLSQTLMSYMSMSGGRFVGAVLDGITADRADFSGTDLTNASIQSANLSGAVFDRAVLQSAQLIATDLSGASFVGANGKLANLRKAVLRKANLKMSNWESGSFFNSHLESVDLTQANMKQVDLRGASMESVRYDGAQWAGAKYSRRTRLPFDSDKANEMGFVFQGGGDLLIIWDWEPSDQLNQSLDLIKKYLAENGVDVKLSDKGHDQFDGKEDLTSYAAVLHIMGAKYYVEMPEAGQLALVNYVRGGGTYIGTQYISYAYDFAGKLGSMVDLNLITYVTSTYGGGTMKPLVDKATHPLVEGLGGSISYYGTFTRSPVRTFPENPSTVIMEDEERNPMLVVRNIGDGHVVNLSIVPNFPYTLFTNASTQRLLLNIVNW